MARRSAIDSIQAKIARNSRPTLSFDIPKGLDPLNERENAAWNDYIEAKSEWKASELRTLHRMVKIESELLDKRSEAESLESKDPFHKEVRDITKLLHCELRLLGLYVTQNQAGSSKGDGKLASQGRGKKKTADISLLK